MASNNQSSRDAVNLEESMVDSMVGSMVDVAETSGNASNAYEIWLQVDDIDQASLIDSPQLVLAAEQTLNHQGLSSGSLTLVLTDDETVQELNRTYRGIDAPTDVLSFPNHMYSEPGVNEIADTAVSTLILPDELAEDEADYLGDLIIALPYTQRQAHRLNKPLSDELALLVVHGILHLLGYDHASPDEEAEMWAIQRQILESNVG